MSAAIGRARSAAGRCGVTRLADITWLDSIGIPVFQAIRPWSRGLSVHQGKGETPLAASLGALMEAVESHLAETFAGLIVRCSFSDLPPAERAPTVGDFASDRATPPPDDEPLDWTKALTVADGEPFWLPFDVVSLDFSRDGDLRLDRSSNGLACRFEAREASLIGLLEVIERDAVADFRASTPWRRATRRIDPSSCGSAWLDALQRRLDGAGIVMRLYDAPSVVALPTIVCELSEAAARGLPRGLVLGFACHLDPDTALRRAVLEAVQSRLTAIAAVRDDILPEDYTDSGGSAGLALPLPPSLAKLDWQDLKASWENQAASVEDVAMLLRKAGYGTVAILDLAPGDPDVTAVKAFVPGLGSARRPRRPPWLSS